jgi:hypothetical protein
MAVMLAHEPAKHRAWQFASIIMIFIFESHLPWEIDFFSERIRSMDSGIGEGDSEESLDLFREPSGYYQPEKPPTFVTYQLESGQELSLRLIGHSPLWVC